MAIDGGVFEEIARRHAPGKGGGVEKIIVDAVALARARGAGGAGDGAGHFRMPGQKLLAQGRFPAAGRRGDQDQQRRGRIARDRMLAGAGSFDVLDLLAEFFQFGFEDDHFAGNEAVVGLGTEGVDFAVDFLREKIEGASDRLGGFEAVVELLEMALQAGQFLGHVGAVGKIEDFLEQALLLQRGRREGRRPGCAAATGRGNVGPLAERGAERGPRRGAGG